MAMMTSTTKDRMAAVPLIVNRRRQSVLLWVRWYFAIPAPAIVNPVNTPMA